MNKIIATFGLVLIFGALNLFADGTAKPYRFSALPTKTIVKAGETFAVKLTLEMNKHWYIYSMNTILNDEDIGPTPTEVTVEPTKSVKAIGKVLAPKPKRKHDEGFNMKIEYYDNKVDFYIALKAEKNLDLSKDVIEAVAYMQFCDTVRCLPPEEYKVKVASKPFKIDDSIEKELFGNLQENVETNVVENQSETVQDTLAVAQLSAADTVQKQTSEQMKTDSQKEIDTKKSEGVLSFLWFSMLAGAAALLTPCVFPMIPITVSFFTKRAEKKKGKGLRDSIIYALGIIVTFTLLGFLLAMLFGATGIQDFATNPWINLFIAAIFIVFALNLFGAFEIQLPTGMMNKLHSKSQGGGIVAVLLMGLTFSLTSFTCTVPFVGSALIAAAGGEWFYPIIGMLGFSAVFAAPFFLLALFPTVMTSLPKAGGWMNNVKVTMGFLEIAAAVKFISNADLVWSWGIMPREFFLAIWVACTLLIALYILGIYRLAHDAPVNAVGTPRILFATFFASVAFFLFAGLSGKQLGELDAFLPPPDYYNIISRDDVSAGIGATITGTPIVAENKSNHEDWHTNYQAAVDESKATGKPLFIDFTGYTCTNCRWMELNMFTKNEIATLLKNMVKVRLFTDRRGEPYASNKRLQQENYNSIELPLYVLLKPSGELVGTKAFTRDVIEFRSFLEKGLN